MYIFHGYVDLETFLVTTKPEGSFNEQMLYNTISLQELGGTKAFGYMLRNLFFRFRKFHSKGSYKNNCC